MSIASELTALQGYMDDAFDAVEEKGGTLPATECMAELADAILSITTGGGDGAFNNWTKFTSNTSIANKTYDGFIGILYNGSAQLLQGQITNMGDTNMTVAIVMLSTVSSSNQPTLSLNYIAPGDSGTVGVQSSGAKKALLICLGKVKFSSTFIMPAYSNQSYHGPEITSNN